MNRHQQVSILFNQLRRIPEFCPLLVGALGAFHLQFSARKRSTATRPRRDRRQSLAGAGSTVAVSVVRGTIPSTVSFVCEGDFEKPADATTVAKFAFKVNAVSSIKCYRG